MGKMITTDSLLWLSGFSLTIGGFMATINEFGSCWRTVSFPWIDIDGAGYLASRCLPRLAGCCSGCFCFPWTVGAVDTDACLAKPKHDFDRVYRDNHGHGANIDVFECKGKSFYGFDPEDEVFIMS